MTLENTNKIYKIIEILNASMRSWSDRDYLRIDIETWCDHELVIDISSIDDYNQHHHWFDYMWDELQSCDIEVDTRTNSDYSRFIINMDKVEL